jgi:dipeptidase E
MGKIVAIGGGELSRGETYVLDKYIVKLSYKNNPKLLFIPTASQDALPYIASVKKYFGELGCQVDSLCLIKESYTDEVIKNMILSADIIYVGGGDTVRMLEKWKEFNVHSYLQEAYDKGIVLSGISAGSICWFKFGHSDGDSFINKGQWDYRRAYGLGFINAAHCPHYNEPGRESFDAMMLNESIPGIALEDKTAFVEENGQYSLLKADKNSKAYLLKYVNGTLQKEELKEGPIDL